MKKRHVYSIIPVRELEDTKLRLRAILSSSQRARLTLSMLKHVLTVIDKSEVEAVVIVCSQEQVLLTELGKRFPKVRTLVERIHHGGVNQAVEDGIEYIQKHFQRVDSIMIIPSDLPLLTSKGIEFAISKLNTFDLVISPSLKRDGTNLLLFNLPHGKITFHYDNDSYRNHLLAARASNLKYFILRQDTFSFDVDSGLDFQRLKSYMSAKSLSEILRAIDNQRN